MKENLQPESTNPDACRCEPSRAERLWKGIRRWVYLNIWCRYFYRDVQRLLHRFNLHHAPPSNLSPEYGQRDHWCQWCGLRGSTWKFDPKAPLTAVECMEEAQVVYEKHENPLWCAACGQWNKHTSGNCPYIATPFKGGEQRGPDVQTDENASPAASTSQPPIQTAPIQGGGGYREIGKGRGK